MTIGPSFCVNARRSGNVDVFRLLSGATTSIIGTTGDLNALGASLESPVDQNMYPGNRLITFKDAVYLSHNQYIFKWNGSAWSLAYTITDGFNSGGYAYHGGLHIMDVGGTTKMVGFYRGGDGQVHTVETSDGSSFSQTDYATAITATYMGGHTFVYRNVLYVTGGASIYGVNPSAGASGITTYSSVLSANSGSAAAFCVFEGRLLVLNPVDQYAGSQWNIKELKFGTFTTIFTTTTAGVGLAANQNRYAHPAFFPYGGKLYAIVPSRSATTPTYANYCIEFTKSGDTFTESDISATVLTTGLKSGGGNTGLYSRFEVACDDETGTGAVTTPKFYIWYLSTDASGGTRTYYEWNGPSSPLTVEAASVGSNYFISMSPSGMGDRIWTNGDLNVWQSQDSDTVATGTKLYFTASGDPGTGDKTVKGFYSLEENGEDMQQMTLVASTVATESGSPAGTQANTTASVTGVDADPSVVYSVVWDTASDGIIAGQRVGIKLTIDP